MNDINPDGTIGKKFEENPLLGEESAVKMISTQEFNSLLTKFLKQEKEFFKRDIEKDGKGEVIPKLMLIHVKKSKTDKRLIEICIFGSAGEMFRNWKTKRKAFGQIGVKLAKDKKRLCAVFLVTEVWVGSSMPKDSKGKMIMPSQQENKSEAVMVSGMTIDGRTNMAISSIGRVGKKKDIPMLGVDKITKYKKGSKDKIQSPILDAFFTPYLATGLLSFGIIKNMAPERRRMLESIIDSLEGGIHVEKIDINKI